MLETLTDFKTENKMKTEKLYYIRNQGYLGNALIWWQEGGGYTCDIRKAEKFSYEKAEKQCLSRTEDTAYECDYIDNLLIAQKLIIDSQYVEEDKILFNQVEFNM